MRRKHAHLLVVVALITCTILVVVQYNFVPQSPVVDSTTTPSSVQGYLQIALEELPNVPELYLNESVTVNAPHPKCGSFPKIHDITFSSIYWQTLVTSGGIFYLYGAYPDERLNQSVRVTALHDQTKLKTRLFCQFWYEGHNEPTVTEVVDYKIIWYDIWGNYKNGFLQPYLITCPIVTDGASGNPPKSLSLVEKPCANATNNLKIHTTTKSDLRKNFAVCVKGLNYLEDLSGRLIEWIELLFLVGVDKIFFYEYTVHENTQRVLRHYQNLHQVGVTKISIPGTSPNHPFLRFLFLKKQWAIRRRLEVIAYNDCLYRNLNGYRYLVLLDLDEIILPQKVLTWSELIKMIEYQDFGFGNTTKSASYLAQNVYFFDGPTNTVPNLPGYVHMLRHVYRSRNYTKPRSYVKCFHDVDQVVTLHNHLPMHCTKPGKCKTFGMSTEDARLQHYRSDCVGELKSTCDDFKKDLIKDTNIWRYKEQLIERVEGVLRHLGLLSV